MSIRYENRYSFNGGLILLCQSIFETRRRISHLPSSAHFTIHLTPLYHLQLLHRHLYISRGFREGAGGVTAESPPLHMDSSRESLISERKSLTAKHIKVWSVKLYVKSQRELVSLIQTFSYDADVGMVFGLGK